MRRIRLGPFNRVEGDLEVLLDAEQGVVRSARVNAPLYRGFENLLLGRVPEDALAIVPRICGICSVAQSAAAASALAAAAGVRPPPNGELAAALVQATENLADHLSHFYLFFMPDFAHPAYASMRWYGEVSERFAAVRGRATHDVLPARARLLNLMGFLAGRWPHSLALQPGGSTRAVTTGERVRLRALLREARQFVERTVLGDTLEAFAALTGWPALQAWAEGRVGDLPAFLRLAEDLDLTRLGRAGDRFLSYGAYRGLCPPGVREVHGGVLPVEAGQITEDTSHGWLAGDEALPPARGETRVGADKGGQTDAYTWCKAPRYAGDILETGALARQLIAGTPLAVDLVARHGASVTARVVARMIELATVLPAMEAWVGELVPGEPFCLPAPLPDAAETHGLVEAARGSLGHWLRIERGRIACYQIIAPTTWNFSPRDALGLPGPLERALVGLPVGDHAPPTVQHVVRSFDPCMVCTVH